MPGHMDKDMNTDDAMMADARRMTDEMMMQGGGRQMPPMQGGEMPPMEGGGAMMPPEATARLMQPSQEIGAVLMARISNMSPDELRMLDSAISPEVIRVLIKLLPELAQIIEQVGAGGAREMPQRGALGGM
jgi:hypothetical protein